MTNFDPTTIQIPFGLLTPEQQDVLMEWPHGWQIFDVGGWADRSAPAWSLHMTYRGKPAPAKVAYQGEAALYELKHIYTTAEVQHLLGNLPTWKEWREILAAGYEQKARADRLEALLREAQSELHRTLYEHMWTKRMELSRRIDAELKGDE